MPPSSWYYPQFRRLVMQNLYLNRSTLLSFPDYHVVVTLLTNTNRTDDARTNSVLQVAFCALDLVKYVSERFLSLP